MIYSLFFSPKGGEKRRFDTTLEKKRYVCFFTQVKLVMLTLNKHRSESTCSQLISCLKKCMWEKNLSANSYSLSLCERPGFRGHNLLLRPPPTANPPRLESLLAATKRVGAGKARPDHRCEGGGGTGSKAGDKWINRWSPSDASPRMTEQQGTRKERDSDRERQRNRDGHRQRVRERRGKERREDSNWRAFPFFFLSCGSSSRSDITKGQQLLQASPGCCGERGDVPLSE